MTVSLIRTMTPPTLAEITAAAAALGLKLPSEYLAFLVIGNGAKPEPNMFDTVSNGTASIVEFSH